MLDVTASLPLETERACEQCGQPFTARTGSGGKPQRFCSTDCRQAHHADKPNVANVGQRGDAQTTLPIVEPQPAQESAPAGTLEDFDWSDTDAVVLPEQYATAVYWNGQGELVIRQRRWPDEDSFVYVREDNLMTFVDRIVDAAGIPSAGGPPPKDTPQRQ